MNDFIIEGQPSIEQQFPQYKPEVFDILKKPASEWTKDESKIIEILVSQGHRESLKAVMEKVRA